MRSTEYTARDPGASILSSVVRDYFETFRVESARLRDGDGLPRFVEDEFRAFLRCGFLAGGFARFRCGDCRTERQVARLLHRAVERHLRAWARDDGLADPRGGGVAVQLRTPLRSSEQGATPG